VRIVNSNSQPSFRGASNASEPGIQTQVMSLVLDSGFALSARPRMTGRVFASIVAAAAALPFAAPAAAQDAYPIRTVRLVVGFGAGGSTDIPARFIADKLGALLGQRIIVENKTGAAGMLATRDVLAQPADGYNLLLCTHFEPINTALYKSPGFKLADLAPVSVIAKYYYGLALSNSIPAETFEQFLQYAKARPGEISYANIGAGSAQEIVARQLEKLAGISMNKVPFRSGTQALPDVIAGRVHIYVSPTLAIAEQYFGKQLKILAITSPTRVKNLPDVPTFKEKGIDYVRFGWLGICARAGTPQPVLDLLNRHIVSIVATPEYRDLIEKGGSLPEASTPQELGQVIAQTLSDVASTIREFGMQIDQ
jgi:tripartite-type tricarboxylate transporter receptor subunit TctC